LEKLVLIDSILRRKEKEGKGRERGSEKGKEEDMRTNQRMANQN